MAHHGEEKEESPLQGITVRRNMRSSKCKDKAVPLRHAGGKGERGISSLIPGLSTTLLHAGEWSASCPGRSLPAGEKKPVPIGQEAGWASELVWTQRLEEKSFASVGNRTPVTQSVVTH
jgi:hypothetical protein